MRDQFRAFDSHVTAAWRAYDEHRFDDALKSLSSELTMDTLRELLSSTANDEQATGALAVQVYVYLALVLRRFELLETVFVDDSPFDAIADTDVGLTMRQSFRNSIISFTREEQLSKKQREQLEVLLHKGFLGAP